MKLLAPLFSAALVAAFVLPEGGLVDQARLSDKAKDAIESTTQSWWDAVTRAHTDGVLSSLERDIGKTVDDALDSIKHRIGGGGDDDEDGDGDGDHHGGHGRHPHRGGHHRGDASKTIYELISESKHTTKFAALVDEHEDIKALLQSTKANRTLFVPTDRAFSRLPPDHKKPPKEFLHALLSYHIAHGRYSSRRLFFTATAPAELTLESLGGHHQRLHVISSLLGGIRINFYSKVVYRDVVAKNGLIHAVDAILVPPPSQAKFISLVPSVFSTFSLALEKSGLAADLADGPPQHGGTLFASTNRAWRRLGPRANAFLFSDHGRKYLRALLEYQIVVNQTLYSDAFYKKDHDHDHHGGDDGAKDDDGKDDDGIDDSEAAAARPPRNSGYWHVDLPSLLHEKPISVDIRRWRRYIAILLNGAVGVAAPDVVASDGVVHIINNVLIPPRTPGHHQVDDGSLDEGEISEVDLRERLEPYLDENRGTVQGDGVMGDL